MELIITELYSYLDRRIKEYKDKYQIDNKYILEKDNLKKDIREFLLKKYHNYKLDLISPSGDIVIIKKMVDSMEVSFNYDYNKKIDSHYIYIGDSNNIFNIYLNPIINNDKNHINFFITNTEGIIISEEKFLLNIKNIESSLKELKVKNISTLELLSLTDDISFDEEKIVLCHSVIDYIKKVFRHTELNEENNIGKKIQL